MPRTIPILAILAAGCLPGLPAGDAHAQAARAAVPPTVMSSASAGADLYRRTPLPRTPPLPAARRTPEKEWKENMARSPYPDDDACLLSFSLGGDLDVRGYKGARLFGTTRTLSRPAKEAR